MNNFNEYLSLKNNCLFMEGVDVTEIAKEFSTPLFVFSENHIRNNLKRFKKCFEDHWPHGGVRILPSLKACPLIAVRKILTDEGCGCDVFGPGELECALNAGVEPSEISVNGSIKDRALIKRTIEVGARLVIDSLQELQICNEESNNLKKSIDILLRIKPFMDELELTSDFAPDYSISELTQIIKYGIPKSELLSMKSLILDSDYINLVGVHAHMGRHSKDLKVWYSWVSSCIRLVYELSHLMNGWKPDIINFGGGFASDSDSDTDLIIKKYKGPSLDETAQTICNTISNTLDDLDFPLDNLQIEFEPGRAIHTDTGIHLTEVKNIKREAHNSNRNWIEVDTSEVFLNIHGVVEEDPFEFLVANKTNEKPSMKADIVGLTCNAEMLFIDHILPEMEVGDIIAILNTGSYIEPMTTNFNSLPRPGSVLVSGDQVNIIKRHETIDDVFSRDIVPEIT